MIVKQELTKLDLHYAIVELGRVELLEKITSVKKNDLRISLRSYGLELLEDKRNILIEKIKNVVIEYVHYADDQLKINFSDYLSEKLNHDYTYMANLFSEVEGTTIEHFIIVHKIEKVKELLVYDELSLTEISYKLHYCSVAHLSNQFKKITGLSPSHFKKLKENRRKGLATLEVM
jgi:AraC-like DNA-binding protein